MSRVSRGCSKMYWKFLWKFLSTIQFRMLCTILRITAGGEAPSFSGWDWTTTLGPRVIRKFCRACTFLKLSRPKPCAKLANHSLLSTPSFLGAATATEVSFVDKVLLWWLERHLWAHTWGLPSAFAPTVKLKMIPVQLGIHNAPMKFILSIHMVYKQICVREIHTPSTENVS